jgi:hypothetical protein
MDINNINQINNQLLKDVMIRQINNNKEKDESNCKKFQEMLESSIFKIVNSKFTKEEVLMTNSLSNRCIYETKLHYDKFDWTKNTIYDNDKNKYDFCKVSMPDNLIDPKLHIEFS